MLEKHNGVVKSLLFRGFIDEMVLCLEDSIILNTIAKVFNQSRFELLVLNEEGKTDEVKLPSTVDVEVIQKVLPFLIDQVN